MKFVVLHMEIQCDRQKAFVFTHLGQEHQSVK